MFTRTKRRRGNEEDVVCTAGCQAKAAAYTDTCPPAEQASSVPADNCEARGDSDNYGDDYIKEYNGKNMDDFKKYLDYLRKSIERHQNDLDEIINFDDECCRDESNYDALMEHRANVLAKAGSMNELINRRVREVIEIRGVYQGDNDDVDIDDIASIASDDVDSATERIRRFLNETGAEEDHDDDSDDECDEINFDYYDGWIEDDDDDDEVDDGCTCSNCRNSDQDYLMNDGMDENDYSDDEYEYKSNFKDRVISSLEDELDEDDDEEGYQDDANSWTRTKRKLTFCDCNE
jgi:hypothetical protein